FSRKQKSRFRIIHFAGDVLHRFLVEARGVSEDRELVAAELLFREDVGDNEVLACHDSLRFRTPAMRRMPSSIISGRWFEKFNRMKLNRGSLAKKASPVTKATFSSSASIKTSCALICSGNSTQRNSPPSGRVQCVSAGKCSSIALRIIRQRSP